MTQQEAQALLDKVVGQVLGYQNTMTLDQFLQKFAFDISLPQKVIDSIDGTETWAQSINPTKFVKMNNARGLEIAGTRQDMDYLRPARKLNTVEEIFTAWGEINYTTTERLNDSLNVSESDNIERSENIYRSQDIRDSRNILFTDGANQCEYIVAGQRSRNSVYCIRLDDSGDCTNCFNVSWSGNLTNCFFMHDTGDMQDSMFCSNLMGKRYCIANMQYDEAEYKRLRDIVVRWLLTS